MDSLTGKGGIYPSDDLFTSQNLDLPCFEEQEHPWLLNNTDSLGWKITTNCKELNSKYLEVAKNLPLSQVDDEMFLNVTEGVSTKDFIVAVHVVYLKYYPDGSIISNWETRIDADRASRRYFIQGIRNWAERQAKNKEKRKSLGAPEQKFTIWKRLLLFFRV